MIVADERRKRKKGLDKQKGKAKAYRITTGVFQNVCGNSKRIPPHNTIRSVLFRLFRRGRKEALFCFHHHLGLHSCLGNNGSAASIRNAH